MNSLAVSLYDTLITQRYIENILLAATRPAAYQGSVTHRKILLVHEAADLKKN